MVGLYHTLFGARRLLHYFNAARFNVTTPWRGVSLCRNVGSYCQLMHFHWWDGDAKWYGFLFTRNSKLPTIQGSIPKLYVRLYLISENITFAQKLRIPSALFATVACSVFCYVQIQSYTIVSNQPLNAVQNDYFTNFLTHKLPNR